MSKTLNASRRRYGALKLYTLMFICVYAPMALLVLISGKSMLWGNDGLYQQYTVMRYTSEAVRRLFAGQGFAMFDPALGQGMDALATLSYYGLTDPLQILSGLFSGYGIELYYHILLFFEIYLSGALFTAFLRRVEYRGGDMFAALSALIFATSGYVSIGIIKNPYYAPGCIYLILGLIGVERYLREHRSGIFTLSVFLMLLANFYMAYQTTLIMVIYVLIRLIARLRRDGFGVVAKDGFALCGAYLLGMGLSAFVFLPSALNYLASGRNGAVAGYTASLLHYPAAYYLKFVALFCAPYDYPGYWTLMSFSPLALMAVFTLFERQRGIERIDMNADARRHLRAGILIGLFCLCVPLAGKVFNGFGYVTNRGSYGFSMAVCLATAWALPVMLAPEYGGRKKLSVKAFCICAVMLLYGLTARRFAGLPGSGDASEVSDMGGIVEILPPFAGAAALFVCALCLCLYDKRVRQDAPKAKRMICLLAALCCFCYTIGYGFVAAKSTAFYPRDVEDVLARENSGIPAAAGMIDAGDARTDTGFWNDPHAAFQGYNGTSYYWSMIPAETTAYYTELELPTQCWSFRVYGLGSDPYLEAAANVRYAVRNDAVENPVAVPYGFEVRRTDDDGMVFYESTAASGMAALYAEKMPLEQYRALDPVAKRCALLRYAIVDEALPHVDFRPGISECPCSWSDGAAIDEGVLTGRRLETVELSYDAPEGSLCYLWIEDTRLLECDSDIHARISLLCDGQRTDAYFINPSGVFNYPQKGVCICLGYATEEHRSCELLFRNDMKLGFGSIRVLSVPASDIDEAAAELAARAKCSTESGLNSITFDVDLREPGMLQIAVPFSRGWAARLDGTPVELKSCGGMYMGCAAEAGQHILELHYVTPGLKAGAIISGVSLAAALALWLFAHVCRRRKSDN